MINLLPPDVKLNISYARRNTLLRKWSIAFLISILLLGGVVGTGVLYLKQTTDNFARQVEAGQADLASKKLNETQAQVQEISNNLKLVINVLSREVLFSGLIEQIGTVIPDGAVLSALSISKVEGAIDLQVAAISYQTGTQVQVNLADPGNKIFDKADILNIRCDNPDATTTVTTGYPCTVQIRARFSKDNPFLFIKPTVATGAQS